jgi:hypothetical protein
MKKNILMSAIAALSVGAASAATLHGPANTNGQSNREVIYITGSTAFRSAANGYLLSTFGANLYASDKGDAHTTSAGNLYFTNVDATSFGGTGNVDIAVYWSGSEAGIQSVASSTANIGLPFFDYTKLNAAGLTPTTDTKGLGGSVAVINASGVSFNGALSSASITTQPCTMQKGSICFSDTAQGTSIFKKGGSLGITGATYDQVTQTIIGVSPMGFFAQNGSTLTNISATTAWELFQQGHIGLNIVTGNLSDSNTQIWASGRFPDSGTRLTAALVARIGTTATLQQFNVVTNSSGITGLTLFQAGTVNGVSVVHGNNGEASGGTLAGKLAQPTVSFSVTDPATDGSTANTYTVGTTTNHIVAYIGVADAAGTAGYYKGALTPLAFDGVKGRFGNNADVITSLTTNYLWTNGTSTNYTTTNAAGLTGSNSTPWTLVSSSITTNQGLTPIDAGYTNICNGSYPYWCYEQIGVANTSHGSSANAYALCNSAITTILSYSTNNNYSLLAPNIPLSDMKVGRSVDGGSIN